MKIVSINNAPTVREDDTIRHDVVRLDTILANIDAANGRNDALRTYVFALRDLQRANDQYAIAGGPDRIDQAQAVVAEAFDRLIDAEFSLNRASRKGT
jgi:hypothetical protein